MTPDDYVLRELRVGDRREAALLADMWNRSDAGWPGGWTRGVRITPERILREDMAYHYYGCWVVEHRGELVGFLSLLADPDQPQRSYVALLNARPDHHGKGVGKLLLRRSLDRSIESGFEEVDLNTWPGNLKAVPLYKKMGFFWAPETAVRMQNFIPTIIRMPLLAEFFAEHDWYEVQQRDLSVAEDVEWWHGARVYRYRFAADNSRIEVVIDRKAAMPTAVETDEVAVAAWVGAEDLSALHEHCIVYKLRGKTRRPIAVTLSAQGEPGVPVAHEEALTLTGRPAVRRVPFRLPADLPRKKPGEPPYRVITTITVDGVPVRLGTGVPVRDPVEVEFSPWGIAAGVWSEARIMLRNRLPFPVSGALSLSTPPELERKDERLNFRIARGGWAAARLMARAPRADAYPMEARVEFSPATARRLKTGHTPPLPAHGRTHRLWLSAHGPGAFAVHCDEEALRTTIESDRLLVYFHHDGGWLSITDKSRGETLVSMSMPEVGPPFGKFNPVPPIYEPRIEPAPGGAVRLTVSRTFTRRPGIAVERTITFTPAQAEVRHRIISRLKTSAALQLQVRSFGGLGVGTAALPLPHGLVRHERRSWGEWPEQRTEAMRSRDFAETWFSVEQDGSLCGLVWEGDAEVALNPGGCGTLTYSLTIPARGAADAPPVRFVLAGADYRDVRAVWANYVHREPLFTPAERSPRTADLVRSSLGASPSGQAIGTSPLLLTRQKQRLNLTVATDMRRELGGDVRLSLPAIVTLPDGRRTLSLPVQGLNAHGPLCRPLTLVAASHRPTAGTGELRLRDQRQQRAFPVPIVIVRRGGRIRVRQKGDEIRVETGWLSFVVSARHGGSIVSLQADGLPRKQSRGAEMLSSSYPTPRPYQWMNPWYGGLRAVGGSDWDRRTHAVERRIEPVSITGKNGIVWKGARLHCAPTHEDCRWFRYEVQYLGTAGSNLLAVTVSVRNLTQAAMGTSLSVNVFPRSGERGTGRFWIEKDGQPAEFRADGTGYGLLTEGWAAFPVGGGLLLALAAPRNDPQWQLNANPMSDGAIGAGVGRGGHHPPRGPAQEWMLFMAACQTLKEAHAYRCLCDLRELP